MSRGMCTVVRMIHVRVGCAGVQSVVPVPISSSAKLSSLSFVAVVASKGVSYSVKRLKSAHMGLTRRHPVLHTTRPGPLCFLI